MSEPQRHCGIPPVECIAAYLGVVPGRARTTLRNLADGGYAVEVNPCKRIRVISAKFDRKAGYAWTPRIQQEGK
jgi:hypothetical protein